MSYAPPTPPVVGGTPAHHSGETNHPPRLVVIHSAVTPCRPGMARQLGKWNAAGTTGGSWHYATDPAETIQCSYDRFVCWAAPPNGHTLHIEMADHPVPVPPLAQRLRARKTWRWNDPEQAKMLERTAQLTAQLCLAYGLPPRYVGAAGQRAGRLGWTTHAARTAAFGQSTHWDPGHWPRRKFARLVRKFYDLEAAK